MEAKVSRTLYIYDADPACPELESVVNKQSKYIELVVFVC